MVSETGKMLSESLTCYKQHLHDNYCRKRGEDVSYKLEQLKIVREVMNGCTTPRMLSFSLQKNIVTIRSQISTLVNEGVLSRNNEDVEINYPVFIDWFMVQINFMESYAEALTTQRELLEMSV